MKRSEIINVHETLKKFPEKEEFLKALYPDAFYEADVTEECKVDIVHPSRFDTPAANFKIVHRNSNEHVGIILFEKLAKPESSHEGNMQPGTVEYVETISLKTEFGYRVEFSSKHSGIKIIKWGKEDR